MTMATKYKLVLLRHGESLYNSYNLFSGWYDTDLTELGVEEATKAGKILKDNGFEFDIAFTSVLKRAIKTLEIIQEILDCHWLPVVKSWRLNERHYGALQGFNKDEMAEKCGKDIVKAWRRSYDVAPPPMKISDKNWSGMERKYAGMDKGMIPRSESLKDTVQRTLPFWHDSITSAIRAGQRVLISAHANSLRGLIKYLDKMSDDDIKELNIPNAMPLVYELDENLRPVKSYYLESKEKTKGDEPRGIKRKIECTS